MGVTTYFRFNPQVSGKYKIFSSGNTDVEWKINYEGDEDYFKLVPTQTGIYSIYTMGITDTIGGIYDSSKS